MQFDDPVATPSRAREHSAAVPPPPGRLAAKGRARDDLTLVALGASNGVCAQALPPFEQVVRRHGQAVLRFCLARVGPQAAEDCFQETMLSALRAYPRLRDATAVRAWLFSIAMRKTLDDHRARRRAPAPVRDVNELAPQTAEGPPADRALWEQVRRLPEKQSQAVALRYLADLSHREIAQAMEISEAAARRNVFEGLKRLRMQAPA